MLLPYRLARKGVTMASNEKYTILYIDNHAKSYKIVYIQVPGYPKRQQIPVYRRMRRFTFVRTPGYRSPGNLLYEHQIINRTSDAPVCPMPCNYYHTSTHIVAWQGSIISATTHRKRHHSRAILPHDVSG